MTLEQYCGIAVGSIDFGGMLTESIAAVGGGVYYMEDGVLYVGSDWDNVEEEEIILEGDSLQIPSLSESLTEALGVDLIFTRAAE